MKRIVVGITGASSMLYAQRCLYFLHMLNIEVHLVISRTAEQVIQYELGRRGLEEIYEYAYTVYSPEDGFAPIASGSFLHDGMIVIPCSMNTVAHIAHGITSSLLHRAADVCCKEQRPLVLVPRESPLSTIHLRNLLLLSEQGICIMPPTVALYNKPETLVECVDAFIFRIFDILHIPHTLGVRWGERGTNTEEN